MKKLSPIGLMTLIFIILSNLSFAQNQYDTTYLIGKYIESSSISISNLKMRPLKEYLANGDLVNTNISIGCSDMGDHYKCILPKKYHGLKFYMKMLDPNEQAEYNCNFFYIPNKILTCINFPDIAFLPIENPGAFKYIIKPVAGPIDFYTVKKNSFNRKFSLFN